MKAPSGSVAIVMRRIVMLITAPFAVVSLLLLLLGTGLHHVPIAVANADAGFDMPMIGHMNIPETLIGALDTHAFAVTKAESAHDADALLAAGSVRARIIFPSELTQNMMIKLDDPTYVIPDRISISIAGSNPLLRLLVVETIARSSISAMQEAGAPISADSLPIPIDVNSIISGLSAAPSYLLEALLGFICWALTGLFALGAALAVRRSWSTAAATAVSGTPAANIGAQDLGHPGRSGAIFAAWFVPVFAVAGWGLYLATLAVAAAILGVTLPAAAYGASLILLLLFAAAAGIGLAAGMNAAPEHRSRAAVPYLILPLFLGGFLIPAELLPGWLQWLQWIFPPAFGLRAALAAAQGSPDSFQVWAIALTACWVLGFYILGAIGVRRRSPSN